MFRRLTWLISAFATAAFLLPAIVFAQGPAMPVQLPFEQAVAKSNADGLQVLRLVTEYVQREVTEAYTVTRKVPVKVVDPQTNEERTEYRDVSEQKVRKKTVVEPVTKQVDQLYSWTQLCGHEISGKDLPAEDLKARLEKPTVVVVSMSPQFPKEYAVLFKPETVILEFAAIAPAPIPAVAPPVPGETPPGTPGERPPAKPLDFELPAGPSPQFRLLSINAQGHFIFRAAVKREFMTTRFQMKTETRLHEGKQVPVQVCEPITVMETHETSQTVGFPASAVQGDTVEGSPLSDSHRAALKQREIPVVVSADGQPVNEGWLANIRPIMLKLITPTSNPPAAPPDVPTQLPEGKGSFRPK